MNKKTILLLAIVISSMLFISGCTQSQSSLKSSEEVGRVVTNVSTDIQSVTSTLSDIDNVLGGK
ncbi:MAG TPA: hypothetical protein VJB05_01270 [archaeon]|nr:hypothetical protein [archaeon]